LFLIETCAIDIWLITGYFTYWLYQTQTTGKHGSHFYSVRNYAYTPHSRDDAI